MIFTLILGFIAGYAAPMVEPQVRAMMSGVKLAKVDVEEGEFDLLTLLLLMLSAALVAGLLGSDGGAIALTLGALLGVFGKRLLQAFTGAKGGAE